MINKYELPNKVDILLNNIESDFLYLNIYFDTGFKDDVEYQIGSVHLAEHIISKSVTKKMNITQFPFIWSNAFTSKEYTCFWHMIKKEEVNLLISYVQEYLLLIQNVYDYKLIDIEQEKERLYAENKAVLDNTLLMNLLFVESQLFISGHSIPTFFCNEDENYFLLLKENSVRLLAERYKNSRITIVITGKITSNHLQSLYNISAKRMLSADKTFKNISHNIVFPDYKRLSYIAYKIHIFEFHGSIYRLDILAKFYQAVLYNKFHKNIILDYEIKVLNDEILFVIFFHDVSGVEAFSSINYDDALLLNRELVYLIKNELVFTLAKDFCDPYKMNFQIFKFYHDTHKLFNKMDILHEIYDITEKDLQYIHTVVRQNEVLKYPKE